MAEDADQGPADLEQVRRAWNTNAAFWDARMGEGNEFHLQLLLPALDRLFSPRAGERVLEVACGNGQLARWMAGRGADVVGIDLSDRLIDLARQRNAGGPDRIEYRVLDACDEAALRTLGQESFDGVVCNMALMDMPRIGPLARCVPDLLTRRGRFVFSTTHPCFNQGDAVRVARWSDESGVVKEAVGLEVHRYLTPRKVEGLAVVGQPVPQPYFERPLSALLAPFLQAGLVVDRLEEPGFPKRPPAAAGQRSAWYSWSDSLREIPPALVVRMTPGPSRRP